MGIYDREYYRDEGGGFLRAFAGRGQACKWLIVANIVAFVIQLATRDGRGPHVSGWFTDLFILDPERVVHGEVWRLFSGGFLHSFGITHILFNMLFLWWMGSDVEDIYGSKEFLAFYFTALLVSSLAYTAITLATGPGVVLDADGAAVRLSHRALGASGAVTAVMVLFAMHYPTRTVLLFFIFPVPVILLVVLNVVQDTIGLFGGSSQPVAFAAHLGGAAFGFLYYKLQWRILRLWPGGVRFRLPRRQPKLRVFRGEPREEAVPVTAPPRPVPDSQLEAELDAVLAKVARHGKSSLTEREHTILLRASEIYRNRRK